MEISQLQAMIEERRYTFVPPTKEHPAICHILRGEEIVGKISVFVLDEIGKPDVKRFLDNIDLRRAIEAERKEEVDVCNMCYGRYLPMRKLQVIYPDWPPALVPQCDYCQYPAKYHVHRSDWVGKP